MRDEVYHQYAKTLNRDHWWVAHRRALFRDWLARAQVLPEGTRRVLELGPGIGVEHEFLREYGPVTGVEISPIGAAYCRERGYAELLNEDLNGCDLGAGRFDLAVDFHVLYHRWVEDPALVLQRIFTALRPGGYLLLTEPAFAVLRRAHDEVVMAARRWNRSEIRQLVTGAGFELQHDSGFLSVIAPAALAMAVLDRFRSAGEDIKELHPASPQTEGVIRWLLAGERALLRHASLPFGTCWAVLARKPPASQHTRATTEKIGIPFRGTGTDQT
jgi:SAM-dependent methyltransferase